MFLHIDKKFNIDIDEIKDSVKHSNCYFTDRISIGWGGWSMIEATLMLLETSVNNYKYDYYHLLSGQDYPLKSQEEIHRFFDTYYGLEFVGCRILESSYMSRVRYYYYGQDLFGGRSIFNSIFNKLSISVQKIIGIDRIQDGIYKQYGFGPNWFSITDSLAKYIINQRDDIRIHFRNSFCADEIFIQTLLLNAPFYTKKMIYHSEIINDPHINEINHDSLRAVDWNRGRPYVYDENDYSMLMNSRCLFARKFSEEKSWKLINMINKTIKCHD